MFGEVSVMQRMDNHAARKGTVLWACTTGMLSLHIRITLTRKHTQGSLPSPLCSSVLQLITNVQYKPTNSLHGI